MIAQISKQTPTFAPGFFGRITGTTKDTLGARSCMKQSKQYVETAANEQGFAETARSLMLTANNENSTKMFEAITKWHLENAADQFGKAIKFLYAALDFNLTTMNRQYIESKLTDLQNKQETMLRFAGELQTESTN